MGNLFSGSNTTNLLSKSSLNIKDIQDLKTQLGNTSTHHYQNNPKEFGELFEGSQVDLSLFSVEEGKEDYLNTFLKSIRNNINGSYLKDKWAENAFLDEVEGAVFKEGRMGVEESGDLPEFVQGKLIDEVTLKYFYRGYSIYQFPETTVFAALEQKETTIENCFLGSRDGELVLVAPSEEPETTRNFRLDISCYILSNDSLVLIIDGIMGVLYEDKLETRTNGASNFVHLDNAYQSYKDNDSRTMTSHITKFQEWRKTMETDGTLMSYAGGEIEGEVFSLGDFLDKLDLS